jgi:hypothetical protein
MSPNPNHNRQIDTVLLVNRAAEKRLVEAHHAVQANYQHRRRHLAALIALPKEHHEKLREIRQSFRDELAGVAANSVASFMLHYFCCEASARVIHAARKGKAADWAFKKHELKLDDISTAITRFGALLDHDFIKRVFGEDGRAPLSAASARRIRDKIAHEMNANAIAEVRSRTLQLFDDMREVIVTVGGRVGIPKEF